MIKNVNLHTLQPSKNGPADFASPNVSLLKIAAVVAKNLSQFRIKFIIIISHFCMF